MSDEKMTFPVPTNSRWGFMGEHYENHCTLCDKLCPERFKIWKDTDSGGFSQSMCGIPVCMHCANVIAEYMIGLREDCADE